MILLVSILIRLVAMGWSIVLLRRIEDRRMAFLTAMLFLMALRQTLTLIKSVRANGIHKLTSVGELHELPGLMVSIFAAIAVVFLARIILERRALAETLDTTVVESQKMEAIGQFAGGVAHDFNNMLTVILGHVDLGKRTIEPDTLGYESLEAVGEAANRAALLTQQLLSFSRRDPIEPTTIDGNQLIETLAPIIRNLVGEHIEVQTSIADEPALFYADRRQIEHVFVNLAVNARDAMPEGGRLTLAVRVDHSKADSILISMRDTGTGIDSDVLSRIFEPFFTTKPVGEGTGLGLATCHAVIARAGGSIKVDSELGKGTEFRLIFPRTTRPVVASENRLEQEDAQGGSEKILLVEDEVLVREVTSSMLRGRGFEVVEASDGFEALHELEEHHADIALVLTDIVMPRMKGTELANRVVESYPSIKILLMSGYRGDTSNVDEASELAFPLLSKPFSAEQLTERIRRVLDKPETMSASLVQPSPRDRSPAHH